MSVPALLSMTNLSKSPASRMEFLPFQVHAENISLYQVPDSSREFQAAILQRVVSTVPQPHLVYTKQRTPEPVSENAVNLLYAANIAYKDNRSRRRHVLTFFASDANYKAINDHTALGYLQRVRMPALAIRNREGGFYGTSLQPRLYQLVQDGVLVVEDVVSHAIVTTTVRTPLPGEATAYLYIYTAAGGTGLT